MEWAWSCPACGNRLKRTGGRELQCSADGARYTQVQGIWRMLTPQQEKHYARFVQEYDVVRSGEQWGSDRAAYYRALPFRDLSAKHEDIWRIRAATYTKFLDDVLHPLVRSRGPSLRVVDAGAGNGWLAYRLALEGHRVMATDLRTNTGDGLGAHIWYGEQAPFVPVQAAFESIPLDDGSADVVIFAGSLHYATEYETVLQEAKRVVGDHGQIVVMETPVYRHSSSGKQMVRELHQRLRREHGIGADALPHENYLTLHQLHELGDQLELDWRVIEPFYGWRWALAPWLAKLRGQREPARFYILIASAKDEAMYTG